MYINLQYTVRTTVHFPFYSDQKLVKVGNIKLSHMSYNRNKIQFNTTETSTLFWIVFLTFASSVEYISVRINWEPNMCN